MNGDPAQLNAELSRLYARLSDVSRQLSDEQALTQRLGGIIALLPYNATHRPRPRPPAP